MYSKRDQLRINHRNICAKFGCKVKISEDKKYCALHEAKPKRKTKKRSGVKKLSKRTYPKEFREAKAAFQLWVRLRAADSDGNCVCISCSKVMKWNGKNCNGGHLFPAKRGATCFDETNVNAQCVGCNKNMDNPTVLHSYVQWYILKHGKRAFNNLERKSRMTIKRTALDMKAIRFKYTLLAEKLHFKLFNVNLEHTLTRKRDYQKWNK